MKQRQRKIYAKGIEELSKTLNYSTSLTSYIVKKGLLKCLQKENEKIWIDFREIIKNIKEATKIVEFAHYGNIKDITLENGDQKIQIIITENENEII